MSNAIPELADQFFLSFSGTSLGLDIVTPQTGGALVNLRFTNTFGELYEFGINAGIMQGSFVGVTRLTSSDWRVSIFSAHSNLLIDNVSTSVSEPATLSLYVGALTFLGYLGRRRNERRPETS
jgi:hypothetical protein